MAPTDTRLQTQTHTHAERKLHIEVHTSLSSHTLRILYASPGSALIAKTNSEVDRLTQLHKHKQHARSQSFAPTFGERTHTICALGAWVHSNNPMVNVLLSGGQRGSLTMCTFRTQSLTAAQSLWRKAWNVSRGQMQAALKGISITSRQAGPYVMVTSIGDTFPDWCPAPCQHAPSWKSTGPRCAPLHCWKHTSFTCADLITRSVYCKSRVMSALVRS